MNTKRGKRNSLRKIKKIKKNKSKYSKRIYRKKNMVVPAPHQTLKTDPAWLRY